MTDKKYKNYSVRALIPSFLKFFGVAGAVVAVLIVGIGFYLASAKKEFRGKEFPAELSENVIGIVNGYQRKETQDGVLKFLLNADVAKTFDDNHQELNNIRLQLFKDGNPNVFDRILAEKAVYIPQENSKEFTIFFAGNVDITTHDLLQVETDQLSYKSAQNIALAEEALTFKRKNISGSAFGARVDVGRNTIELQKDVEVRAFAVKGTDEVDFDLETANLRAGYAFVDGGAESVKLRNAVAINIVSGNGGEIKKPTAINSNSASVYFVDRKVKKIELDGNVKVRQEPVPKDRSRLKTDSNRAEVLIDEEVEHLGLFDNVIIETTRSGGSPMRAKADSAVYQRSNATYELRDRVEITGTNQAIPIRAAAGHAIYRELSGDIRLTGGAEVSQSGELVKGEIIYAKLSPDNTINFAKADENAYLKQTSKDRFSEVFADSMSAWFGKGTVLKKAEARGNTKVSVVPDNKAEYSMFRMNTPNGLDLSFSATGTLSTMTTRGRSTLFLDAGAKGSAQSDKRLSADTLKTVFKPEGNELSKAHAIGNAELTIEPRSTVAGDYNSVVTSPRFDCDFFPGNIARNCVSTKRTKVKRESITRKRPLQFLEADTMTSVFERTTRNLKAFESSGSSKFTEGDKTGIAERMVYTSADETVRFRGGNPTFWDSRARGKAAAIDWNTKNDTSDFSGAVSTTYYNQAQTGNSAPFSDSRSPVFVTSDSAHFEHKKREAVYVGGARAWQDKNYVRGNKLFMDEKDGRFFAEGDVQSILFDAQRTAGGKKSKLPVFVSAGSMLYLRDRRQVRYEKDVDIRQGPDRILGKTADIFLEPGNTLSKTIIIGDVVITQPNRRVTGDYAEHDAVNETIVVKGSPAEYSDSESGSSTGKVLTVDLKNNTAVNSGSDSKTGTGRIRSVYKVKPGRLN